MELSPGAHFKAGNQKVRMVNRKSRQPRLFVSMALNVCSDNQNISLVLMHLEALERTIHPDQTSLPQKAFADHEPSKQPIPGFEDEALGAVFAAFLELIGLSTRKVSLG